MCFSFEASVAALIIGLSSSIALFRLGSIDNKILGAFFGFVSLMQGIDALLWKHQVCDDFHKSVTSLGMLLNLGQPLALAIIVYLFNPKLKNTSAILFISAMYLIYTLFFINHFSKESHCTSPRENDPHLVWNWAIMKTKYRDWSIYGLALCSIFILGMASLSSGILFGGLTLLQIFISMVVYPRQSIGSLWCFFIALTPMLMYTYRILT